MRMLLRLNQYTHTADHNILFFRQKTCVEQQNEKLCSLAFGLKNKKKKKKRIKNKRRTFYLFNELRAIIDGMDF